MRCTACRSWVGKGNTCQIHVCFAACNVYLDRVALDYLEIFTLQRTQNLKVTLAILEAQF